MMKKPVTTRLASPAYIMLGYQALRKGTNNSVYMRGAIDMYFNEMVGEWVLPSTAEEREEYPRKVSAELKGDWDIVQVAFKASAESEEQLSKISAYHQCSLAAALRKSIMYRIRRDYPAYDLWVDEGAKIEDLLTSSQPGK